MRVTFGLCSLQSELFVELCYGWSISASKALTITAQSVWLQRPKLPITGPNGVQATFGWQASEHPTLAKTCTITLVNDVGAYWPTILPGPRRGQGRVERGQAIPRSLDDSV
jgi:hypothetical protein